MSDVDHKAEAMLCIHYANSPEVGWSGVAGNAMTQALVHATLYAAEQTAELVKQQRIANLIAFLLSAQSDYNEGSLTKELIDRVDSASAQVLEGLGL